ncbi:MAG: SWIM zinc finger family protein [Actinomycetota bacterium]|nr:SWIM zinc finger family protein [Actinomycetota bacterium]
MARSRWDDPWQRFPESVPLPAPDGLATSKQRGAMAGTWWSKRFVELLESYGLGTRMARGRRYARSGQVVSLDVRAGMLLAQVQGSRRTPYVVTIATAPPTDAQWNEIDGEMVARVGFVARLLAGEVPADLEAVFTAAGTNLLPSSWAHLAARCSCPDSANPCKHVAAVLYLFADRLDADPWLLLTWRGRSREQILAPLRARAGDDGRDALDAWAVAPWWPFGPNETVPVETRRADNEGEVDAVEAADPADVVLRRCVQLEVSARGVAADEILAVAYRALADPGGE